MDPQLCVIVSSKVHEVIRFLTPKTDQLLKFIGKCVRCMITVCLYRWCVVAWTHFPMNFNSWLVLGVQNPNNYTLLQLHFQYCVMFVFCKALHYFHSVARNSKIISPCNVTLILDHKMPRKKIRKLIFETTLVIAEDVMSESGRKMFVLQKLTPFRTFWSKNRGFLKRNEQTLGQTLSSRSIDNLCRQFDLVFITTGKINQNFSTQNLILTVAPCKRNLASSFKQIRKFRDYVANLSSLGEVKNYSIRLKR